jgi:hypothetical protein
MGIIQIALLNENGGIIDTVKGRVYLIGQHLPSTDDDRSQCLRFIDSYGDTVFNRPQMEQFIIEWQGIMSRTETDELKAIMNAVLDLAKKCRDKPHRYLKFYGD